MICSRTGIILIWVFSLAFGAIAGPALAYDITDRFSIGGVLAGAYQHQEVNNIAPPDDSIGRGAVPLQIELDFALTEKDHVAAKFGFAAGDGLNGIGNFQLAPWAADLESDLENLNGTGRDYLLTAYYTHEFQFREDHSLVMGGGIIDSTDFLDQNAYSNDEYTQFMNESLVNGPNAFLPSYDIGGGLTWDYQQFSIYGAVMNVGQTDVTTGENNYMFYGIQFGYRLETSMGEGNYRLILDMSSPDFLDPTGTERESKMSGLLSFDQAFGENFGGWIRFGWQDDKAAITYDAIYSGGVQINGKIYGRDDDAIGIGVACLPGSNQTTNNIDSTRVAEIYYRFVFNEFFALTADAQYMADRWKVGDGPDGYILGARAVVEF